MTPHPTWPEFLLTGIGSTGPKITGTFKASPRRDRPKPDEGPADYEFEFDCASKAVRLSIIKWNGKTYVAQPLATDSRSDLKDMVRSIVPMLTGVGAQVDSQKQELERLRNREACLADCLADLIIGLKAEGVRSGVLSEAIQHYEHVVGPLAEAEEEREVFPHTYLSKKTRREKSKPSVVSGPEF